MKIVRVRGVGNSNVVSLPRALERLGYTVGTDVAIDELPNGELRLVPTEHLNARFREITRQVVEENREALDRLATHDRGGIYVERPTSQ
jgi:antitoxin component of MazEF toxin-antitoxin module